MRFISCFFNSDFVNLYTLGDLKIDKTTFAFICSSGTHYEDLGRKNKAYVNDDLNIEGGSNVGYI